MAIVNLSVTHKNCTIRALSLFNVSQKEQFQRIQELLHRNVALEVVNIRTCNRFELFLYSNNSQTDEEILLKIKDIFGDGASFLIIRRDDEAIKHLFDITTTLDSMIIGEHQILGQVKDAFNEAITSKTANTNLSPIFERAIRAGKRVRTETTLCEGNVSMASVAVRAAENCIGAIDGVSAMVLGAGKISRMIATMLKNKKVRDVYVTNRGKERALELAKEVGGVAVPFEEFRSYIKHCDVIFCASSAPHTLIHKSDIELALAGRDKPLLLVDVAMPPDVDETIWKMDNVTYYGIDYIRGHVNGIEEKRRKEIPKAQAIINEEVAALKKHLKTKEKKEIIRDISMYMDSIREQEVKRLLSEKYDEADAIEAFSHSVVKKILHNLLSNMQDPDTPIEHAKIIKNLMLTKKKEIERS
ncbi:MAG: glutamyl-tRNA reductase [Candidatus Methanofastidiosia archaeon]